MPFKLGVRPGIYGGKFIADLMSQVMTVQIAASGGIGDTGRHSDKEYVGHA